jgi:glycosyltransferase involved in cell wall biosynthesis
MNPMITVVMPTFNSAQYVVEAANSILNQTCGDFEFLVINEYGSNDGTIELLNALDDPRIRIIQNTNKLGIAESLNVGIREARGKYIARMDSDDLSVSQRFEKQVSFMEANPKVGICGGWIQYFGKTFLIHRASGKHEELKVAMMFGCDMCHSVVMMRREALSDNDLWYSSAYFAEDYELWTRAVHCTEFANLQEVLGYYRARETNRTMQNMSVITEQEQDIYARTLRMIGMDYKADYPERLLGGWMGFLQCVPQHEWRDRLERLKGLLLDIRNRNKQNVIYDEKILLRCLYRQYMRSLDIDDDFLGENGLLPFEMFIEDILDDVAARAEERKLCVFALGRIGLRVLPHFVRRFGSRLVCVSDNDVKKWDKRYGGLACVPPDGLDRKLCIVITAGYESMVDIADNLTRKGFGCVIPYVSSPVESKL